MSKQTRDKILSRSVLYLDINPIKPPEEVIMLAGNSTGARRDAERKLKNAKMYDADPKDIAILQAAYDAARTKELNDTGKNEQARSLF